MRTFAPLVYCFLVLPIVAAAQPEQRPMQIMSAPTSTPAAPPAQLQPQAQQQQIQQSAGTDSAGTGWSTPQVDYPFGQVKPLTDQDQSRLREIIVEQNRGAILSPENVGGLRQDKLNYLGAKSYPGYPGKALPRAHHREIRYVPNSGRPAEQIKLAVNTFSPMSFLDDRGRKWPISDVYFDPLVVSVNGNGCERPSNGQPSGASSVFSLSEKEENTITIIPCGYWAWGSIAVRLYGGRDRDRDQAQVPLVFMLSAGTPSNADASQNYVDTPIVVRVAGLSPAAMSRPTEMAAGPARSAASARMGQRGGKGKKGAASGFPDRYLDDFANGTPPKGARPIRIGGYSDVSAWEFNGKLYVRGPITVVNPIHDAEASYGQNVVWRFDRPVYRILVLAADGREHALSLSY